MKKLIVFDLDGTLALSKSPIDSEMSILLDQLLASIKVAVISGGNWPQFQKQVLSKLSIGNALNNLSILPLCGTKYYFYDSDWKKLYEEDFNEKDRTFIIDSVEQAISDTGLLPKKKWGELIEDRGSQITYSALGQDAPLKEKQNWDPDFFKRKILKTALDKVLGDYSVNIGGSTSIDITAKGVDKSYGIEKLHEKLGIEVAEMIFIGDALFKGGNDEPVRKTGAYCIKVRDPEETKRIIEAVLAFLG
ncbi:HAD-IIB family hydrolase [Pedobacter fastidiosus]|uniref:phosphomannomutase n=1 Tax=Pedobacter fastidiosus TaxID=2765361 RepID=A0ABR7KSB5_9SPHI|nr:HAD-IIB family hydrolase [Pedobacter fastidiosus]MBC6110961.1 HAD-IIB family hydrolase [Pedobacter fastidiosus]